MKQSHSTRGKVPNSITLLALLLGIMLPCTFLQSNEVTTLKKSRPREIHRYIFKYDQVLVDLEQSITPKGIAYSLTTFDLERKHQRDQIKGNLVNDKPLPSDGLYFDTIQIFANHTYLYLMNKLKVEGFFMINSEGKIFKFSSPPYINKGHNKLISITSINESKIRTETLDFGKISKIKILEHQIDHFKLDFYAYEINKHDIGIRFRLPWSSSVIFNEKDNQKMNKLLSQIGNKIFYVSKSKLSQIELEKIKDKVYPLTPLEFKKFSQLPFLGDSTYIGRSKK